MIAKSIKQKLGPIAATGIIAFIAFVFIFSGVFSPKATRGLHDAAVAGTVNGDPITRQAFARELSKQMEFYKQILGGKVTEAQIQQLGVGRRVFNDLAQRQVMVQAAKSSGRQPSDEEVRESLIRDTTFHENGRFDPLLYKRILQANQLTPATFEKMVREGLSVQSWMRYFGSRVHVSESELRDEYLNLKEKRKLGFVVVTPEYVAGKIKVAEADFEKAMKDDARVRQAQARFEAEKDQKYKSKTFDQVKAEIVRSILASDQVDETKKLQEAVANELVASGAQIAKIAKSKGLNPQSSGMIGRAAGMIPGLGDATEVLKDAFAPNVKMNQPKMVRIAGGWAVAWVEGQEVADMAKFDAEKASVLEQVQTRKARILQGEWLEKEMAKAKIDMNPSIVGG